MSRTDELEDIRILYPADGEVRYARVSGPQVAANKRDRGDKPTWYVFVNGEEHLVHEVFFHGKTLGRQDFNQRIHPTGAIIWLETRDSITTVLRSDREVGPHNQAEALGHLDDALRP